MKTATHFIAIYNVLVTGFNNGVRYYRMDYNEAYIREMKYLEPFSKSVGSDMTAIFKIKFKNVA